MAENRIPLDTLYIMVAQKVPSGTPTKARQYCEALQEVIYEQLVQNDSCYWYGLGNFERSISKRSGGYKEITAFQSNNRRETMFIEPKYVMKFDPAKNVIEALNDGEEKLPRKKYKKKYTRKYEAQEVYYEKNRKKPESMDKWLDGLMSNARYAHVEEENEDGEEGYNED